ncbi:PDDEXK family nuclease [Polaribacter gochangensis]|uniref:transcriptional regulator n=1 Tax=Polaribacter gochangensis TaxID=3252903 RepID=UPI00390487E1
MNTQFDIEKVLEAGKLKNELELERAMIADRKLRILCKENSKLKPVRKQLRDLIEKYEAKNWSSSEIDDVKLKESDLAELIAEKERQFTYRRKELIKKQLKKFDLIQQDLMTLLGHNSKTHMSELMNGISPFTLNDLIVINRLLKIDLTDLVPTTISQKRRSQIKKSIQVIGTKKIKLSSEDFDLAMV